MKPSSFLWLLPTVGFLIGYSLVRISTNPTHTITPNLIGITVSQACHQISPSTNGIKIISTLNDPSIPPDTIVDQIPHSGSPLRPYQYIYVTVSTTPPPTPTIKQYLVPVTHSKNIPHIVGTYSTPHDSITYIAAPRDTRVILPNYCGTLVTALKQELELQGYPIKIIHQKPVSPTHLCTTCTVIEQHPVPGTIIQEKDPITVIT